MGDGAPKCHALAAPLPWSLHPCPSLLTSPGLRFPPRSAGHYVPYTVSAVERGNARLQPGSPDLINLAGLAVGNGLADFAEDFGSMLPFARSYALLSPETHDKMLAACDGDAKRLSACFLPPELSNGTSGTCTEQCAELSWMFAPPADGGVGLDIYDIYLHKCPGERMFAAQQNETRAATSARLWQTLSRIPTMHSQQAGLVEGARMRYHDHAASHLHGRRTQTVISPYVPDCWTVAMFNYLNHPTVQQAIHVAPAKVPTSGWAPCNPWPSWYKFSVESMLPKYRRWAAEGKLDILIYSGDTDSSVTHLGTTSWLRKLGLDKLVDWQVWRGSDGQIAGYLSTYKTAGAPLTFATIKGAGHSMRR